MNPLTIEWITKAEGDFSTAGRELRARKTPNYDAVCFHSQQSIEKYLKAVLQENGIPIPKTHVLQELLVLCMRIDPIFESIKTELNILEGYAVQFRYPGITADKADAQLAYKNTLLTRIFVRNQLGLS